VFYKTNLFEKFIFICISYFKEMLLRGFFFLGTNLRQMFGTLRNLFTYLFSEFSRSINPANPFVAIRRIAYFSGHLQSLAIIQSADLLRLVQRMQSTVMARNRAPPPTHCTYQIIPPPPPSRAVLSPHFYVYVHFFALYAR